MTLGRDTLLNALLALVVIGSAAWIVSNTEWIDEEVRLPARDEAARDRLYAVKHIVSQLGATVESPQNLGRLPPANATLVLSAWNSGIAANCTPTYGLFGKVLSFGLALSMAFFSASANFAAFRNSALA